MVLLSHLEHFWLSLTISVRSCSLLAQNAAKQICLPFWTVFHRFRPKIQEFQKSSQKSKKVRKKYQKVKKIPYTCSPTSC